MIKNYRKKAGVGNTKRKTVKQDTKGKSRYLFESNLVIDGKVFRKGIHLLDDKFLIENGVCSNGKCPLIRKL